MPLDDMLFLQKRFHDAITGPIEQRDDERHDDGGIIYQTKKVYAELGRRVYEQRLFSESDDFYFLARNEVCDLK